MSLISGNLAKMVNRLDNPASYRLPVGTISVPLNQYIGQPLSLNFTGRINCIACGRLIKKSFQQGYCFPCVRKLAVCDICMVKPEKCHYAAGTCREPLWGEAHCLQDHYVYLANTSGVKVGITRLSQVPTRWIDQGAVQALPLYRVKERLISGLLEVRLKNELSDRTDWRRMLCGAPEIVDLPAIAKTLHERFAVDIADLRKLFGEDSVTFMDGANPVEITYPVSSYPEKISAYNLDKTPEISDVLLGIKGQYLIFAGGVLNVRKYGGYFVELTVGE
ncbi:MAG TPA: DUF2797 domain-containing protein [Proteobacteria bacterium]|nr:DUF2797 domain-containing protein [Pseudomonadota bacterium]